MVPVSEALRELLHRQGMSAGSGGTEERAGIGAGLPKGERIDPLTAQAGGVAASRYVNGKGTPAEPAPVNREAMRQSGLGGPIGFDYVVHTNHAANNMPARKATQRKTSVAFLTVIDGGRV